MTGDKDDSRSLHVTIHRPTTTGHGRPMPLLCARFVLDDHIRCMAAKQRLTKGRLKARQRKMQMIARLLQLPTNTVPDYYPGNSPGAAAAAVISATSGGKQQNSAALLRTSSVGGQTALRIPGKNFSIWVTQYEPVHDLYLLQSSLFM